LSKTEAVTGPSLAEVIAFTMIEPIDSVARVEEAARRRLRRRSQWIGWRVFDTEMIDEADEMVRLNVFAEPARRSDGGKSKTFEFYLRKNGQHSDRFAAFIAAAGVRSDIHDTFQLEGRYFSTLNEGRHASEFGPLSRSMI
jgi:hypothetical protein